MQAWAGSFDGLLHRDIAGVNTPARSGLPRLRPGHSDSLWIHESQASRLAGRRAALPGRAQDAGNPPAPQLSWIQALDDPVFAELLKLATDRRLIVQLAFCMEDARTQPPLMRVPAVDIAPLADVVKSTAGLRLELLNCTSQHQTRGLCGGACRRRCLRRISPWWKEWPE